MRRRAYLAAAGAALSAGCPSLDRDGPSEPSSASIFAGEPCQPLAAETTCYHTADEPPDVDDVVLEPETERLPSGPIDTTFTLHNGLDRAYAAALPSFLRRTGGRWQLALTHAPPGNLVARRVEAGETATFELRRPDVDEYTTYGRQVPLGGGTFSYFLIGSVSGGKQRYPSAYVRVAGDPLRLGIPEWVEAERDGDSISARRTDRTPQYGEWRTRFRVILRDAGDVGTPVSPELGSRHWALGVGLRLLQEAGVETVVVRSDARERRRPVDWLRFARTDPETGDVDPELAEGLLSYRGIAFSVTERLVGA